MLAQRQLEPDVAHHRRDDGVAGEPPLVLELAARTAAARRRRPRCGRGDRRTSARSPSPSNATPSRAVVCGDVRGSRSGWPSTRSRRLMLRPSGVTPMARTSNPSAVKSAGASDGGRAVGAVERRGGSREAGRRPENLLQMRQVRCASDQAARDGRPRPPAPATTDRHTSASTVRSRPPSSFSPRAGEHLDAVVLERVVRRGDHDAGIEAARARQIRDARRRHHARRSTPPRPRADEPARELLLDPVARLARVAADQHARRAGPARQPGRAPRRRAPPSPHRAAVCPPVLGSRRSRTVAMSYLPVTRTPGILPARQPHLHGGWRASPRCRPTGRLRTCTRQRVAPGGEAGRIDEHLRCLPPRSCRGSVRGPRKVTTTVAGVTRAAQTAIRGSSPRHADAVSGPLGGDPARSAR